MLGVQHQDLLGLALVDEPALEYLILMKGVQIRVIRLKRGFANGLIVVVGTFHQLSLGWCMLTVSRSQPDAALSVLHYVALDQASV